MISRCPSCGSSVKEEEPLCPSCGWDFVARKRVAKPAAGAPPPPPPAPADPGPPKPKTPPPPAATPSPAGGFALPPARNLNEAPPQSHGLKPLPKLEPRASNAPGEGENPFTLPTPRAPLSPDAGAALPPARVVTPPGPPSGEEKKPAPAAEKEEPSEKNGFGARLMRSFRGDQAPPAEKKSDEPPLREPEKKEGLSLPPVRPPEPVKKSPPPAREPDVPPRPKEPARRPPPPPPPDEESLLDLDGSPDVVPLEETPPPPVAPAREREEIEELPPEEPVETMAEAEPVSDEPRAPESEPEPAPAAVPAEKKPARAAAPKPASPAPENATPAPQSARNSPVYIAAIAGAALGTVSVVAIYMLRLPDTSTGVHPSGESPFSRSTPAPSAPAAPVPTPAPQQSPAPLIESSPAPVAPVSGAAPAKEMPAPRVGGPITAPPPPPPAAASPAPPVKAAAPAPASPAPDERPAASFATLPRVVVGGQLPAAPKPKAAPAADSSDEDAAEPAPRKARPAAEAPARPRKPKGPAWNFEGVVFDLLTARGVFAAKLVFLDADGNVAGESETGPGGRYKVALPPGGAAKGYTLKIIHADYTDHYIDEGDATSSLREATPEERRILMQAAARNLPWVGNTGKTIHRDLALVPKSPEEP
jgi:hypothetical protein